MGKTELILVPGNEFLVSLTESFKIKIDIYQFMENKKPVN